MAKHWTMQQPAIKINYGRFADQESAQNHIDAIHANMWRLHCSRHPKLDPDTPDAAWLTENGYVAVEVG